MIHAFVHGRPAHLVRTRSGSGVAKGDFECCRHPRNPREQWSFTARETHWGHTFLVWTLTGNPSARNEMGKRFVRWVK